MKLVRRLTAYLLGAVAVVLAVDTWSSVQSHLALLDEDMRQDQARMGRALVVAVERVWKNEGQADAAALLTSVSAGTLDLRARLVPADRDAGPDVEQARTGHGREARLVTRAPVRAPDGRRFFLEVSESLTHERAYALHRVRQAISTALAAVVASGLVAWLVGVRVVGRPIEQLVEKARRVARADFSRPLSLKPRTELAQLADEMNEMAANLARATREIEAQSAARVAAQEQLRHADRLTTVGKLASGLAHELGTPLNVIAGRARMIEQEEVADEAEAKECARIIVTQTERMTGIVHQLLDFARRRGAERQRVDLSSLSERTVALLRPLAAKRGIGVEGEAAAQPVIVSADATQLQQAIINLAMNAIQASASGSRVRVSTRAENGRHPRTGVSKSYGVVEVTDSGAGISAEHLEQIFDPFFTTKAPGEGTGLGLSVAFGIAEDHGGWIDAKSEVGGGSRFRVWLPLEPQ